MTKVEKLSRAGIPYGIRKDGSLFAMLPTGDIIEVADEILVPDLAKLHRVALHIDDERWRAMAEQRVMHAAERRRAREDTEAYKWRREREARA